MSISIYQALELLQLENVSDLDPEQVRRHCKKLLLHYHPDKPGGNREIFEHLKEASNVVMKAIRKSYNPHTDFKQEFTQYDEHTRDQPAPIHGGGGKFNIDKFNKTWEQFEREGLVVRRKGYGDMIARRESDPIADFGKHQIVRKFEPDPIWLGIDDVEFDSASGVDSGEKTAVHLSAGAGVDYREAYMERTIDDIRPSREEYKSQEQYARARDRETDRALSESEMIARKNEENARKLRILQARKDAEEINKRKEQAYDMMTRLLGNA